MKSFNRWIRSKSGMYTIASVLLAAIILATAGQLAGWWNLLGGLAGTAGGNVGAPLTVPAPSYPDPAGGYTCLPSCNETDAKFVSMVGENMASFGGANATFWIGVPGNKTSFDLGVFDGDSGKNNSGLISLPTGNWDTTTTECLYTLYADPLKDGKGMTVVGQWKGNTDNMPNNAWWSQTINNQDAAKAPGGPT